MKTVYKPYKVYKPSKKLSKKMYNYTLKSLNTIRFDDMLDIFGIDVACKMVKYYSGCQLYIPKPKTLKMDFLHTIIRAEYEQLRNKDKINLTESIKMLSSKYHMHIENIFSIIGYKNHIPNFSKTKFQRKIKIDRERDKNLLYILQNYWDRLKEIDLV